MRSSRPLLLATWSLVALLPCCLGCFELADSQSVPPERLIHLDQNWTPEQRSHFYHASQGTVLMKSDWFLALEQPEIKFFGKVGLFRDDDYLTRFGFLSDEKSKWNPAGLPVGFAISEVEMPVDGSKQTVVGLTCAACHTGELHYKEDDVTHAVRIDGASALLDVTTFQKALGAAILLTAKNPLRFDRFAHRILDDGYSEEAKAALKQELDDTLSAGAAEQKEAKKRQLYDGHDGGFGRTDALAKIGNFVFGTELSDDNLRIGNAPVRFPPIWDSTWFDWSQYNGSIEQPMVRNIGEALGVRALVNLNPTSDRFMKSTVDVESLHQIEMLLSGDQPLQGLHSPRWPSVFGLINHSKAEAGAHLYRDLCQPCHLPPLQSDEIWEKKYWVSNDNASMVGGLTAPKNQRRYLNLEGVNLGIVGTDPGQATNFFSRYVSTGRIVLPSITMGRWSGSDWDNKGWYEFDTDTPPKEYPETMLSVGVALQKVTVSIANQYYDDHNFSAEQRAEYNGYRNPAARAPLEYRPRPLNGIWASPPFLHNGSIRTIFQLLSPHDERDVVFYTGSRQYDPKHLGFKNERIRGAFKYDTRVDGNRNSGHLFDSRPAGHGVIGPALSVEERLQIIEFLKTLGPAGPPLQPQ